MLTVLTIVSNAQHCYQFAIHLRLATVGHFYLLIHCGVGKIYINEWFIHLESVTIKEKKEKHFEEFYNLTCFMHKH